MMFKQVSVFLENKPGALCELTDLLSRGNIDLFALNVADTTDFGIVRIIVRHEQIPTVTELLTRNGFTCRTNHVLCVSVEDRPGGLHDVLSILDAGKLSVEYMYSFLRPTAGKALLILRLSDNARGEELFLQNRIPMLSPQDVEAM